MDYTQQLSDIIEGIRAGVFYTSFLCGLVFVGLFGKRWFF